MVRARGVLARGDDREVRPLVAGREHPLDQLAVHVELGAAREGDASASRARSRRPRARHAAARRSRPRPSPCGSGRRPRSPRTNTHDGTARCRSSTKRAHVWSPIATRARRAPDQPRDERDGIVGLFPRHDLEQVRRGVHARRFEPGHDELDVAGPRQHQHRQPFERHRLVAGEVRADRARPTATTRRCRSPPCAPARARCRSA